MASNWPKVLEEFARFLTDAGLRLQSSREAPVFDDKIFQFVGKRINVRVVSDRGAWYVEVADASHQSNEWYDAAILHDCLVGSGEDVLPLQSQIEIVETNWATITSLFSPGQETQTHDRLVLLRKERGKRRLPGLFDS